MGRTPWNKGLTKEDERVLRYAQKLVGKPRSAEHCRKISEARSKGAVFYDNCQRCRRRKGHSKRLNCCLCAAALRKGMHPNGMTGRKLSASHKQALLEANGKQARQTKPEARVAGLLEFMFGHCNPYRYAGCGEARFWISAGGRSRNPDFVARGMAKVIEVFGRYWHPQEDEAKAIAHYKAAGWDCLVIWDDDFIGARDRIMEFSFFYEYLHEFTEDSIL